jgi:serine/threonine protein phosphatase PrpC
MGRGVAVFRIYSWAATDVGMKRDHNEDSFLVAPDLNLCVVADGMGGHAGGEMASGISVRSIERHFRTNGPVLSSSTDYDGPLELHPVARLLPEAIRAACAAVYKKSKEVRELNGMGTTTTAIAFHGDRAFVAHVGDSRAYLVRDGRTLQLSEDHSLVAEQMKAGLITEQQAKTSRFKNIITRSVGVDSDVDIDMVVVECKANDVYLVCCDGLSNLVQDDEMGDIVTANSLNRVPEILIDLANSRGGDDNITVVVAAVVESADVAWEDDVAVFDAPEAPPPSE